MFFEFIIKLFALKLGHLKEEVKLYFKAINIDPSFTKQKKTLPSFILKMAKTWI